MRIRIIVSFIALLFIVAPAWAGEEKEHEQGESKVSIHGYGELHHNNPTGGGFPDETKNASLDMHRMVWGVSYTFDDRWSLHTEIDFEHAAQELELEFAYLEYRGNSPVGFRIGHFLMPVGPLNEYHEPPLFYSVERSYVQKFIIPTTWSESGFGIFGESSVGLKYRLYVVSGLNATKFSDKDGMRGGRQFPLGDLSFKTAANKNGIPNNSDKFGGVGRLEYTGVPGLAVGVSYYNADANGVEGVGVTLWDVDLRYKIAGFDLSLLSAQSKIKGAKDITKSSCVSTVLVLGDPVTETCTNSAAKVGEEQAGQYGEVAYHLNHIHSRIPDIVPFYRVEKFNTQDKIPAGATYTADPKYDLEVRTYGLAYYPHPDIAIKVDQEQWKDGAGKKAGRTNVGVAYMF